MGRYMSNKSATWRGLVDKALHPFSRSVATGSAAGMELERDTQTLLSIAQGELDLHGPEFRDFYRKAFDRACVQLKGLGVFNQSDREDIAQIANEVFLPGKCTFKGHSSAWTWHHIVVTRTWAAWVNQRVADRRVFDDDANETVIANVRSNAVTAEEAFEAKRYKDCIADAAQRFTKMKRTERPDDIVLLQMLVLDDSSIDEVAKRLNISYGATQQRLGRIKKQFEKLAQLCAGHL